VENAWGEFLSVDDTEVEQIYQLFVQSMEGKRASGEEAALEGEYESCNIDWNQYDDVIEGYSSSDLIKDPQHAMSAWRTVLVYLMSNHKYLHE